MILGRFIESVFVIYNILYGLYIYLLYVEGGGQTVCVTRCVMAIYQLILHQTTENL